MQIEQYHPVLNGLTASVFLLDSNRLIVFVNNSGREVFGDGLEGADFVQAVRNPQCLKSIAQVLEGKAKSEVTISVQNPVRATYQVTVTRLSDDPDPLPQAPCVVVSLENISHIIDAEHMRSEFVANVSHELRSPLTALSGFIETLQGAAKNDPEARAHFLTIMEHEAGRMNRLIGDLLSLSKVEADAHLRPDEAIDLNSLIARVTATLEPMALAQNTNLHVTKPQEDSVEVSGDHDQLQQVFANLIENAIKYGRSGGEVDITLTHQNRAVGIRGPAIRIDITDQGAGIEGEHIARLTERFYRVDKGRSREMGGTGLGLAIVKHILTRHRGRLQVVSKVGRGSTFSVFLPA